MEEIYSKEAASQAVDVLVGGFNAVVEECFRESLVVSSEANPFSVLPPVAKVMIIRDALLMLLGQVMAVNAINSEGQVADSEIFSGGALALRHYYTQYLKQMRGQQDEQSNLGQGLETESGSVGTVSDPGEEKRDYQEG